MRFELKRYGNEAVAYDSASGDTHYLTPLALALFQICREQPGLSRADVKRTLAQRHAVEGDPVLDARIDEALDGLCRIGFVRLK